jgi:drug/metabolite transporter (DMT)-like permease
MGLFTPPHREEALDLVGVRRLRDVPLEPRLRRRFLVIGAPRRGRDSALATCAPGYDEPPSLARTVPNWLLFLVPSLIWGTTWLVIKFQLGAVAPEVSVAWRFGIAALLLFGWCALRGVRLGASARAHASFALLGVLQFGLNYVLVYLSEQLLTSGLVSVVFVLLVFWNLLGARVLFRIRAPASVVAGAVLGILGVAAVFLPELRQVSSSRGLASGVALALLATLVASAGNLWSQHLYARGVEVVPSTAWSMLYASLSVALFCLMSGIPFTFDASIPYVASLLYLAVFGSVFAFVAYLTLIRRIGAGRSGYTAAAIPVLAMITSTAFEGYRWTAPALAGMVLVLAGNVLVLRGKARVSEGDPARAARAA